MAIEINARKREAHGTGASRRLRRLGRVPGIVYGGDQGPINIDLDHKDLYQNLRNEKFHASILTLALGDGLKMTLAGVALGAAGAVIAGRSLVALTFGVTPLDPSTIAAAAALTVVTTTLAVWWPALAPL